MARPKTKTELGPLGCFLAVLTIAFAGGCVLAALVVPIAFCVRWFFGSGD